MSQHRNNSGRTRAVAAVAVVAMSAHVPMPAPVIESYAATQQYAGRFMPQVHGQYAPPLRTNGNGIHIFQPRREVTRHDGGQHVTQNNSSYHGPRTWQGPSQKYRRSDLDIFEQELEALAGPHNQDGRPESLEELFGASVRESHKNKKSGKLPAVRKRVPEKQAVSLVEELRAGYAVTLFGGSVELT